jgi:hypothetical protein
LICREIQGVRHEYKVIVPTLADSTVADGIHLSAFLIRAATANPVTFFL